MPRCGSSGYFGVPTPWRKAEGHTARADIARRAGTPRGQRPHACTEAPRTGTGRSRVCLRPLGAQNASGTPRGHADDGRTREVGQLRSTWEAAEQSRGTGRGGGGGKGAGQGEFARAKRVPDSGPGRRVKCARAGTTGSSERKAAAVHGAPAPRLRQRPPEAGVLRPEARRRSGGRRRDVAALRRETRRES
jgi:hypothetical protein